MACWCAAECESGCRTSKTRRAGVHSRAGTLETASQQGCCPCKACAVGPALHCPPRQPTWPLATACCFLLGGSPHWAAHVNPAERPHQPQRRQPTWPVAAACWSLLTGLSSLGSARLASTSRRSMVCCTLITCRREGAAGCRWEGSGGQRGERGQGRRVAASASRLVSGGWLTETTQLRALSCGVPSAQAR